MQKRERKQRKGPGRASRRKGSWLRKDEIWTWVSGIVFQAEGTAGAKALRQECAQVSRRGR